MTGANTGIGWEVAKELATHGARVILASRSAEKVADAVKRLKACRPTCTAEGYVVDLASLRRAAAAAARHHAPQRPHDCTPRRIALFALR